MKLPLFVSTAILVLSAAAPAMHAAQPSANPTAPLKYRWFFCFGYGRNREGVDEIKPLIDPAHNARNHYYGAVGDFAGSWKFVPKDLTIVCWHHKIRDTSQPFFSTNGFKTIGAGGRLCRLHCALRKRRNDV